MTRPSVPTSSFSPSKKTRAKKAEPKVIDIVDAMNSTALFQPWFRGASWDGWRTILKAAYALPMTPAEVEFFRAVAERDPPEQRVRELWIVVGRHGGKDSIASLIAAPRRCSISRTSFAPEKGRWWRVWLPTKTRPKSF
jgi:hypothetical protein